MRFNNDADAYMFLWNVKLPDRWAVQKEIWYDRATLLPKLVLLFDENGRVVLRAYLSNYKSVEVANVPHGLAEGGGDLSAAFSGHRLEDVDRTGRCRSQTQQCTQFTQLYLSRR